MGRGRRSRCVLRVLPRREEVDHFTSVEDLVGVEVVGGVAEDGFSFAISAWAKRGIP
jgi:hypothetical protein